MYQIKPAVAAMLLGVAATCAQADTTNVKTQTIVEVKKMGEHSENDPKCFNRDHPAINPVARAPRYSRSEPLRHAVWRGSWRRCACQRNSAATDEDGVPTEVLFEPSERLRVRGCRFSLSALCA